MSVPSAEPITFLFTDIEGSTRLWHQQPEQMEAALAVHDAVLQTAIEHHGGQVFKTIGDAFCAAFTGPQAALQAALQAQSRLHREVPAIRVRMAVHTGEVQAREGDYFGPTLNHVARLLAAAHGGQILLSRATADRVRGRLPAGADLRLLGVHALRDIPAREEIFQLEAAEQPNRFPPLNTLDVAFRRGLRRAAGLAAIVLVVVGSLAVLASVSARRARAEAVRARNTAATLRRNLYAGDMTLAQQALEEENLDRAIQLLAAYRPAPGQEDVRTFEWRYLWEKCQDHSRWTFKVPNAIPTCADFSPDGKVLAVACTDWRVRLYNLATHQELSPLPPLKGRPRFLTFSPDGNTLAIQCTDQTVLYDLAGRRPGDTLPSPSSDSISLGFSPDGRILATAGASSRIQLWDRFAHRRVEALPGERVVAFSPRAFVLATCSPAGTVLVRNLSSGTERKLAPGGRVVSLAFSRDGRRLVAGLTNGDLRLWDVASGTQLPAPRGHRGWVYSVAFSPRDRLLATSGVDSTVRLWDLDTRREVACLRGHRGEVVTARFSPDGGTLASACVDGTVKLWDVASNTRTDDYPDRCTAISPDGRRLALMSAGARSAILWDAAEGRSKGRINGGGGTIVPLCFSPRGDAVYSATSSNTAITGDIFPIDGLMIWSVADGKLLDRIPVPVTEYIQSTMSKDGRFLALVPSDIRRPLAVIDLVARRCTAPVRAGTSAFSPDGRLLAMRWNPTSVRIYDTATWGLATRLTTPPSGAIGGALCFSQDGRRLAIAGFNVVQIWDTTSWRVVDAINAHSGLIHVLSFSPDGRTLVTCAETPIYKFWNTATWRQTLTFKNPRGTPWSLQFTADGNALAVFGDPSFDFQRTASFEQTDAAR